MPAIVVDVDTNEVLTLAYMNESSSTFRCFSPVPSTQEAERLPSSTKPFFVSGSALNV